MITLIDISHVIVPCFFGYPRLCRPSDNHPVGAVHGVCSALWHLTQQNPPYVAVVYDPPSGSTARKEAYPQYKANRKPMDEALKVQLPLARRAADVFDFARAEYDGYEADDVIATLVRMAVEAGHEVTIISSDKDLTPLVRESVVMFDPVRKRTLDVDGVIGKYGVHPRQMVDLLAMWGDATDNIPGIHGVGPKKAADLLKQFGNLENCLANVDQIALPGLQRSVREGANKARFSKAKLVTLDENVPVTHSVEDFSYSGFDRGKVLEFLDEMELVTLKEEIEQGLMAAA